MPEQNIYSLISIGTFIMLMLAGGIVVFFILYQRRIINHQMEIRRINELKQLELLQASIQGEEEERMRIASELHDDVGATLSSIRLFLHKADSQPDLLTESRAMIDDSIQKIRNISHKLQPDILNKLGLDSSLVSFSETITKSGAMQISYRSQNTIGRFDSNVELSIYRIVQELINNLTKHAHPKLVTMQINQVGDELKLVMEHDGEGLTNEVFEEFVYKKGAIGLKNIVNRLNSVKGAINFAQTPKGTFSIIITVPLIANNAK